MERTWKCKIIEERVRVRESKKERVQKKNWDFNKAKRSPDDGDRDQDI